MSLLVGSVFMDHPRSKTWYELQIKYLHRTTNNFEHVVYLNGYNDFYNDSSVLKVDTTIAKSGQDAHIRGLNFLLNFFNSNLKFENLLLLDSDCFPIQPYWLEKLLKDMKYMSIAAPIRYENLDTFAHPCAFFVRRKIALDLKFDNIELKNLIGRKYTDTGSNIESFYPLIRSNKINHHSILCGIYKDYFYHHGAGSRSLSFRLFDNYLKERLNIDLIEENLFQQLVQNSDEFINNMLFTPFKRKIL